MAMAIVTIFVGRGAAVRWLELNSPMSAMIHLYGPELGHCVPHIIFLSKFFALVRGV